MNKIVTLLVLIFFTSCINAQWGKKVRGSGDMIVETRTVSDYDEISAGGSFDVKLVAGTEGKLTISIDDNLLEYLVTEVDGDRLKLKWKKGSNISHKSKILITVPFKDISEVSLAGSGDVYNDDLIKANNFKTQLSGSGDVKLNVESSSLDSSISGSGSISLEGGTGELECSISGSGNINAMELSSKEAEVRIAGSGGIKVNVENMLTARISGSGNVRYKGSPRVDAKVSGSGNVTSY